MAERIINFEYRNMGFFQARKQSWTDAINDGFLMATRHLLVNVDMFNTPRGSCRLRSRWKLLISRSDHGWSPEFEGKATPLFRSMLVMRNKFQLAAINPVEQVRVNPVARRLGYEPEMPVFSAPADERCN